MKCVCMSIYISLYNLTKFVLNCITLLHALIIPSLNDITLNLQLQVSFVVIRMMWYFLLLFGCLGVIFIPPNCPFFGGILRKNREIPTI